MLRRCFQRRCPADPRGPFKIVECPRDAMQGLSVFVPTEEKIRYINALLKVGFHTVDCGSFVSARGVPQMRDTAEVLAGLDMKTTQSKLLVVVANQKGAQLACQQTKVTYVGYPLSVSEAFQHNNTRRNIQHAVEDLKEIQHICAEHNKELVTYLSMAFGNPYQDPYSVEHVEKLAEKVVHMGCRIIALADTVGIGTAQDVQTLFGSLIPRYPMVEFGGHFHSSATSLREKVNAAVDAGCWRLDGAIGGMGGCPFAASELVGNAATEGIVETLASRQISLQINKKQLEVCKDLKHEIFGVAVKEILLAGVLQNERWLRRLCEMHFDRHDTQEKGYLNKEEFGQSMQQVFHEMGEDPPSPERIQRAFKKINLTNDDVITFEEYMYGVRHMLHKVLDREKVKVQE